MDIERFQHSVNVSKKTQGPQGCRESRIVRNTAHGLWKDIWAWGKIRGPKSSNAANTWSGLGNYGLGMFQNQGIEVAGRWEGVKGKQTWALTMAVMQRLWAGNANTIIPASILWSRAGRNTGSYRGGRAPRKEVSLNEKGKVWTRALILSRTALIARQST